MIISKCVLLLYKYLDKILLLLLLNYYLDNIYLSIYSIYKFSHSVQSYIASFILLVPAHSGCKIVEIWPSKASPNKNNISYKSDYLS